MTEFRRLREALGWSLSDTREILGLGSSIAYDYDAGRREPHRHTMAVLRIYAADWFPPSQVPRRRPRKIS